MDVGKVVGFGDRKLKKIAVTGTAQWVGRCPANWKAVNWIPSQGTCLGVGACGRQLIDVPLLRAYGMDVSLPLFPFSSLPQPQKNERSWEKNIYQKILWKKKAKAWLLKSMHTSFFLFVCFILES